MENIIIGLGIAVIVGAAAIGIYQFCKLTKQKQIEIVLEWLLLAVVKAEKELGSGTGQIKLRFVYDLFIDKFKFLSMFISFERFSKLVDQALDTMKDMIANNKQVKDYIEE
jgi:hypothetical protein